MKIKTGLSLIGLVLSLCAVLVAGVQVVKTSDELCALNTKTAVAIEKNRVEVGEEFAAFYRNLSIKDGTFNPNLDCSN